MQQFDKPNIKRIVVRGPNWLGDAVMAVPALRELARLFPEAEIILHIRSSIEDIFVDADFIDGTFSFEKGRSRIKHTVAVADALGEGEFDLAILFPNSFESALTTKLARIPRRIGYNKDLRGLLLTDPIAVPEWKNSRHEVYYYLNIIAEVERRFLGGSSVAAAIPNGLLPVSDARRKQATEMLRVNGADNDRLLVAIGAGSTNSMAKRWGTARFVELCSRLMDEDLAEIVLLGSSDEAEIAREIGSQLRRKPIDLTARTSVAEAAAILSVADLLVSNDMGLAHVAPAVGTDTIVIFGPTNPETTRPFAGNARVIREPVDCSPCMLRDCPIDHRCMTRISVDRVLAACREMVYPSQE